MQLCVYMMEAEMWVRAEYTQQKCLLFNSAETETFNTLSTLTQVFQLLRKVSVSMGSACNHVHGQGKQEDHAYPWKATAVYI